MNWVIWCHNVLCVMFRSQWLSGQTLTRLVDPRVVAHLQHEQLAALEALSHRVDARDGGTLQPHGHQRFTHLLVAVILKRDLSAVHHRSCAACARRRKHRRHKQQRERRRIQPRRLHHCSFALRLNRLCVRRVKAFLFLESAFPDLSRSLNPSLFLFLSISLSLPPSLLPGVPYETAKLWREDDDDDEVDDGNGACALRDLFNKKTCAKITYKKCARTPAGDAAASM